MDFEIEKGSFISFSEALLLLKSGRRVARLGWNNAGISVKAQFPDEYSKMTKPYLYMIKSFSSADGKNITNELFPLDLSCESLFADDWVIVE